MIEVLETHCKLLYLEAMTDTDKIRNFSIVAHIDHGKSTLADRLIQECGGLTAREMSEQVLDNMDIERERGITIKAQTVRLDYKAKNGESYVLNLMDTPGHVDFGYEVSRSLSACEGSLLVVDASQGVEAQTLANVYQALDADHDIITVLNKMDLPAAEPDRVKSQIEDVIGLPADEAIAVSAKTGMGIEDVLEKIIATLPAPKGDAAAPLKALLVDSWYDAYLGVMTLVRVHDGVLKKGMKVRMMATGAVHTIERVGVFGPKPTAVDQLGPGEIGFINAAVKTVSDAKVGDTITEDRRVCDAALPGFKPSVPVVFCGLFPIDTADFPALREALEKLSLNDSSFSFEAETSAALGFGFRCGFLGLLHMDVFQERLEQEFNASVIITAPTVSYKMEGGVDKDTGLPADLIITAPSQFPKALLKGTKNVFWEPMVTATILCSEECVGPMMELCEQSRGMSLDLAYLDSKTAQLSYRLPLASILSNFYEQIKSLSAGYASVEYEEDGYQQADLVVLTIQLNGVQQQHTPCQFPPCHHHTFFL